MPYNQKIVGMCHPSTRIGLAYWIDLSAPARRGSAIIWADMPIQLRITYVFLLIITKSARKTLQELHALCFFDKHEWEKATNRTGLS